MTYEEMIRKTAKERTGSPEPGSELEKEAVGRFTDYFTEMTPERVESSTRDVYAGDAILHDTLATHEGIDEIQPYFKRTAERADGVRVRIDDWFRKGHDFYFRWTMDITWSAFRKGETTRSVGISQIRFDRQGKVVLHHDFWDSASGFFEHLPVVGWLIRAIKKRV